MNNAESQNTTSRLAVNTNSELLSLQPDNSSSLLKSDLMRKSNLGFLSSDFKAE